MAREKRGGSRTREESAFSRVVSSVFAFVRLAEFEILFSLFFIIAFVLFKDLIAVGDAHNDVDMQNRILTNDLGSISRPEYNQILVKKPDGAYSWRY